MRNNKTKPVRGRPKAKAKKQARTVRKPVHSFGMGALVLAVVFVTGWSVWAVQHSGTIKGLVSSALRAAPLEQTDTTKLYTVEGVANGQTMLVKFKKGTAATAKTAIHGQTHAKVKQTIPILGVEELQLPADTTVGSAMREYKSHSEVEYAEPNFVAQRFMSPDDALYQKQWNLFKIDAASAWDVSQGGYGPIAIIDTGINAAHADLKGQIKSGFNFVNDSTNTADDNGHGTHVAGIISGQTNNTTGVASIGFKGTLLPVKVLDASGAGNYADVASGIVYAVDNGAKIINLSLGGSSASQTLASAVQYAMQKGVIIVAAAGNNGNTAAVYPADYPGVIAVAATTASDTLATFSSYGSHTLISAPGVGIISTYSNGSYATMSGTSMAAPEVSGLLGLALAHSNVPASELLDYVKASADKVGPYGYDSKGWNQYFGYGRINAGKLLALLNAPAAVTEEQPTQLETTALNSQTVHGQANNSFSADIAGYIDSIDIANNKVTIKVQTISQNLKIAQNNLVDLYFNDASLIKSGKTILQITELHAGDKLSGKVLWQENKLTAVDLKAQLTVQPSNSHTQASRQRP